MPHVDPDILALSALGEPVTTETDRTHLDDCDECAATLEELRSTAVVGRASKGAEPLLTPPSRVWDGIAAELGLAADVRPDSLPAGAPSGTRTGPQRDPSPVPVQADSSAPLPPASLDERRQARRPVRRGLLIAVAAVGIGILGVSVAQLALRPPQAEVVADAELEPFPAWPDASGEAVLEALPDGTRQVTVTLDASVDDGSFREVWLIKGDASDLVSIGVLEGTTGTFEVPDGIDVDDFNLVDVSEEPRDGDPAHSGDSIVRGPLA